MAKYCTYSIQSTKTKKIISTSTIRTKKEKGSAPLETEGFKDCLSQLETDNINVQKISTDRNKQIAKWLRENRPNLNHRFDPWHFSKNIKSKLRAAGKKKSCKILLDWMKAIGNHLFYCSENSGGDPDRLIAMWKSLLQHVTNVHEFPSSLKYPKCAHKPLSKDESSRKKWIDKDSVAF